MHAAHRTPNAYTQGAPERLWAGNTTGHNCELLRQLPKLKMSKLLKYTAQAHGNAAATPSPGQLEGLSKIDWGDECLEHLEPLTGGLRHPFHAHSGCWLRSTAHVEEVSHYDLGYLLPTNGCQWQAPCTSGAHRLNRTKKARNLLYDLGCSKYRDSGSIRITGGYGSSLPLFQRMYSRNCITFDAIWGWEARPYDYATWWADVPPAVRPKLTFINEPVNISNTLEVLATTARPSDFVVLKLDIDTPALEWQLMHRIRDEPHLAARIDELYFEVDLQLDSSPVFVNDAKYAKYAAGAHEPMGPVDRALELMRSLRRLGIRSHFWV